MQAADALADGEDDLHLSEEEDDDADNMSLASDLDDADLEEVMHRQKELEQRRKELDKKAALKK